MQEFKKRYNEDGGTNTFIIPSIISNDDQLIEIKDFQLYQNYPNPFNPITTIRFDVARAQNLKLAVYDLLGREVKVLFDQFAPAGLITVDFKADELSSGLYIYRLIGENVNFSRKMMLLK